MFDPADNLSPADPHAHAAVCFLEAIGDGDTTEVFKRAAQSDALNWITRTLEFGVNIGLGPEAAAPILFETLNEIRALVAARIIPDRAAA
jgi:hypothetical protein